METIINQFKGVSLHFLPDEIPDSEFKQYAYYAILMLCDGEHNHWSKLLHWPVLKSLLYKRDPKLMAITRDTIREGFENLYSQLAEMEMTEDKLIQAEIFINNSLEFLTYFDFKLNDTIKIPQWIDSHWELVNYKVDPILLTRPKIGFDLFTKKSDRYYAYGLVPINNDKAPAQLVFSGTPYPSAPGCWISMKSDFEAKKTVGESLYIAGKDILSDWIAKQHHDIHASGISLGASIALLLAVNQGEKIKKVHAYNPAGLYESKKPNPLDRWNEIENKPFVRTIRNGNDPISKFGHYKADWEIYRLKPSKKKQAAIGLLDHALNFAGDPETEFSVIKPDDQNDDHRKLNRYVYGYARTFVYRSVVLPIHYGARPFI